MARPQLCPNPTGYDPYYHFQLAIESGCNAYAALEAGAADFAGQIPLNLKLSNHDVLPDEADLLGAQTATVADALRLGCVGTSARSNAAYSTSSCASQHVRPRLRDWLSPSWSHPRGGGLSGEGEAAALAL